MFTENRVCVEITIIDDDVPGGDDSFTLTFNEPLGVVAGNVTTSTVTILDDGERYICPSMYGLNMM